jgi:hypothetical protein
LHGKVGYESISMNAATAIASPGLVSAPTERKRLAIWRRGLLLLGLAWALIVVVPDVFRLFGSLAQFGVDTDNSGVVYQVDDPASGLRIHDRIVLRPGSCWAPSSDRCRDFLAVFGGMGGLSYVHEGTTAKLRAVRDGGAPFDVKLSAAKAPLDFIARFVLALDEIAGVAMIWLAFMLVWDRPSQMTLGFFLYAMWFNPGQYFTFYAWLQHYPLAFLVQEGLQAIAQGAGYAGFLIFALRFPHNRTEPYLRPAEWLAIGLGIILSTLQLASFSNAFGFETEYVTRAAIFGGYAVSLSTILVVLYRLKNQPALDYQRMRWVLWGCLIGIPAFVFADSNEATSFWAENVWNLGIWRGWTPNESVLEFGYLLCGMLAIFIWTAVRHPRVLNVTPQLVALAVSTIFFAVGYKLEDYVRDPMAQAFDLFGVPAWMQFLLSLAPLALLGLLVHRIMHTTAHLFNLRFHRASEQLEQLGKQVKQAKEIREIDAALVNGPSQALRLASAAAFRRTEGGPLVLICNSKTWAASRTEVEPYIAKRLSENLAKGDASAIRMPAHDNDDGTLDITAPAVILPVVFDDELQAVALYSPHATGADLDHLELGMLQQFAEEIAVAYEKLGKRLMEQELQALRRQRAGA